MPFYLRAAGYGFVHMLIVGATVIAVLPAWPDPLGWLKLAAGLAGAFGTGVYTYGRDPENAWKAPVGQ